MKHATNCASASFAVIGIINTCGDFDAYGDVAVTDALRVLKAESVLPGLRAPKPSDDNLQLTSPFVVAHGSRGFYG
jgi:hypothetical protein